MPEESPSRGRLPGQWFYASYAVLFCAATVKFSHWGYVLPVWGVLARQAFAPGRLS